jgi:hypothetical protein
MTPEPEKSSIPVPTAAFSLVAEKYPFSFPEHNKGKGHLSGIILQGSKEKEIESAYKLHERPRGR